MIRLSALPAELRFISELIGDRYVQYREAKWRTAPFEADIWTTLLGMTIDFNVRLDDGRLLTDVKHQVLLNTFKIWLCLQSHGDSSRGKILALKTIYIRLLKTMHLIDYFLLNARRFRLSQHGLQSITANDFSELLHRIAATNSVAIAIYQWPDRLAAFLRAKLSGADQAELSQLISRTPMLNVALPETGDRQLNLTEEETIFARAWLWQSGFYRGIHRPWCPNPNTRRISKLLYSETLLGVSNKPVPAELYIDSAADNYREYPMVPDRDYDDERRSETSLSEYLAALRRLGGVVHIGLPVPESALMALDNVAITSLLEPKSPGRFLTVPRSILFSALRSSIEFSLEYGEDLVCAYLNVAKQAKLSGLDCRTYALVNGIDALLTDKLRSLGVKGWTIDSQRESFAALTSLTARHDIFSRLRDSEGLWELLRVLYGSAQVCTGLLAARRQEELTNLVAGKSLDIIKAYLIFRNGKSGIGEMREKEARPIPPVVVRLVSLIERLQDGLIEIGDLDKKAQLFAFPRYAGTGLVLLSPERYNESLDYFCDYFETPLNLSGERYYLRQHQLRRFFAMLFFWGRAFGGMDTLRWFLGHTDIRHLYNYITESVPGAMLQSIKATYAVEQLAAHEKGTEMLADVLERHFGTRRFSVLDSQELNEYIEDLLAEGVVEIEPEFFDGPNGESYRILIVVKQQAAPK